jgi:ketosteroid isomerase-like protein
LGLLADDVEWYDPAMPRPPARGRDQVRAFVEAVLRAFPDFRCEVRESICVAPDGTRCAIPWRITATHTAPLVPPGFAPTGRQFCQDGIDLLEVRAGRVVRIQTYFDLLAAAEQLLALTLRPPSGTVRERLLVFVQRLMAVRARRLTRA